MSDLKMEFWGVKLSNDISFMTITKYVIEKKDNEKKSVIGPTCEPVTLQGV